MNPRWRAFVRNVSPLLGECELSHLPRVRINIARAQEQHANYARALARAGVAVETLPDAPQFPDGTFVEDPALILDEFAVICRSGNENRLREADTIAPNIARIRKTFRIEPPGALEGGDVLRIGRRLYVGMSERTNAEGARQLRNIAAPYGYEVIEVEVKGCLHLKTAATAVSDQIVIANRKWIDATAFGDLEILEIPAGEPSGANILSINETIFVAASAPRTADLLARRGLNVEVLDISEFEKAEAGLTCLSLIFKSND
jgi:dimethylargininase